MSTNKVNVDGVMLFEQPFARVRQTTLGVGISPRCMLGTLRELSQSISCISKEH